ncbi:MAG: TonB family protein [Chitinivibrionales bacterium]|nr:TonB family protein [Chitinivibrionales bacterium]MBD3356322.1 TonB family protein [Chitinivibrionales bacterium]
MNWAANAFFGLGRFAIVLAINISLFLIIPATHDLFGSIHDRTKQAPTQRKVVAELVKPKQEKEKAKPKRRLRSVQDASAEALRNPMKFKFSPDLSVAGAGDGVAMQSQELSAEVFEEGEAEQDARPKRFPSLQYPDRARELAVEGTVVVRYIVDVNGKVYGIEEISSPHPSLTSAVRRALENSKFEPAMNKGVPVKQRVQQSFDFHLD